MKHDRVSRDSGAEVGIYGLFRLIAERRAVDALQDHACHSVCDDFEASSYPDNVESMHRAVLQLDALLRKAFDRSLPGIHDFNVRPVELLEIIIF